MIDALPLLLAPEGYQISRSVRLRSSASAYFSRTLGSGSTTAWTWSAWIKRGVLGASQSTIFFADSTTSNYAGVYFTGDVLNFINRPTAGVSGQLTTTQVFRDPSAWYHLVAVWDTANGTSGDRLRLYVNGVRITAFSTATYPAQNTASVLNSAIAHELGATNAASSGVNNLFDGYLTEINFIDGQALTPSSFGETDTITGVWKPKKYTGTYGTNGFYLNFSDNSNNTAATIGRDFSGNGNNWTPNNISVTAGATYDSMLDVPTLWGDGGNGRGNYAVLNPTVPQTQFCTNTPKSTGGTIRDGNLTVIGQASNWNGFVGTHMMTIGSGQWYWEVTDVAEPLADYFVPGIINEAGTVKHVVGAANFTVGDVIGFVVDGNGVGWYKNGVSQGYIATGLSGNWYPQVEVANSNQAAFNFGQRPFAYTPPSGFKALNTLNLPEPTIKKGNLYFDATTYTGNGSTQSITNSGGMQPDLVWIKRRQAAADHALYDSSRTLGVALASNSTGAEGAVVTNGLMTAYNSNGFSVAVVSGDNTTNGTAGSYVGWQWKEGATQGFDIVTYTGNGVTANTIAHTLGVTPSMIIVKERGTAGTNWMVKHKSLATKNNLFLQGTNASTDITTAVSGGGLADLSSSSTFGFLAGTTNTDNVNRNGGNFVAYLFAEVAGFSRFGSYTGNGSADGPFVFCGFRPRFFMIKRTDSTGNWQIFDSSRLGYNVTQPALFANGSDAEAVDTNRQLDFVSNGVKLRQGAPVTAEFNSNGATYIFAAFAETPFKNALAR